MDVSGQVHAPVALNPRNTTSVLTEYEAGWALSVVLGAFRERNNLLSMLEFETRFFGCRSVE
jgi:hypothetical protein